MRMTGSPAASLATNMLAINRGLWVSTRTASDARNRPSSSPPMARFRAPRTALTAPGAPTSLPTVSGSAVTTDSRICRPKLRSAAEVAASHFDIWPQESTESRRQHG